MRDAKHILALLVVLVVALSIEQMFSSFQRTRKQISADRLEEIVAIREYYMNHPTYKTKWRTYADSILQKRVNELREESK